MVTKMNQRKRERERDVTKMNQIKKEKEKEVELVSVPLGNVNAYF